MESDPIDLPSLTLLIYQPHFTIDPILPLGSDCFKDKIAAQLNRRAKPNARGGDRKSEAFKKSML